MLKFIKIKNFKSIDEEIELSFEPIDNKLKDYYLTDDNNLKIAILYGSNASGKTNIIKAFGFLERFIFNPPQTKDKKIDIEPFKFKDDIDENSQFELEFIEDGITFNYRLILSKSGIKKEELKFRKESKRFSRIFYREANSISWGSKIKISASEKDIISINTLLNNSLLSSYLKINIDINELNKVVNFFKKILSPIYPRTDLTGFVLAKLEDDEVSKEEIIDILQNADFSIDGFEVNEHELDEDFIDFLETIGKKDNIENIKNYEILFKHYKKYILDYAEESSGTQRFYQLAVILILLSKKSYILAIDEIESSLHPDLLKFFLLSFLANTSNSQIILTTHLRELLQERDILRNDTIWFCQKRDNGSTELFSLSDFKSDIRENSSIYNFYKLGKIGANPNIKNFLGLIDGKKN